MNIRDGKGLSYDDVLLVPKRSPVTDLDNVDVSGRLSKNISLDTPIVSANMDTVTEEDMAVAMSEVGGSGAIHRFCTLKEQAEMVRAAKSKGASPVGGAIGVGSDALNRSLRLMEAGADYIVVDVAHGHLDRAVEVAEMVVKQTGGEADVVAGNVATPGAVEDFNSAGVDAVKVGIGPGSHCTTRKVAGAGVPQITAISDCSEAAPSHLPVIADGGIRTSGDIVKALMAGAESVMIGGLLGGTEEAPGNYIEIDGERYKKTRGMASEEAREEAGKKSRAPEGVEGLTPYSGSVEDVISRLVDGIRSGISYCGADNVTDAWMNHEFIRVSGSTKQRNGMHGEVERR